MQGWYGATARHGGGGPGALGIAEDFPSAVIHPF